jgi:hypothetical protein
LVLQGNGKKRVNVHFCWELSEKSRSENRIFSDFRAEGRDFSLLAIFETFLKQKERGKKKVYVCKQQESGHLLYVAKQNVFFCILRAVQRTESGTRCLRRSCQLVVEM